VLLSPMEALPAGTLADDILPIAVYVQSHVGGGRCGSWQQWIVTRPGIGRKGTR